MRALIHCRGVEAVSDFADAAYRLVIEPELFQFDLEIAPLNFSHYITR
jgi:hypothetical protein